ncbi:MAG: apolipoprotein N-acyltransferase [Kiritimatiellae bacterium]|nr:apolipoprotein N-acyltransferase [Kiritimatiellia bacterium]
MAEVKLRAAAARAIPFAASIGGGVLLRTAFPPFDGGAGVAFLALVPIFLSARLLAPRRAAIVAFCGMFVFFASALSWFLPLVGNGGPPALVFLGMIALGAWCAAFSALFGWTLSHFWAYWRTLRGEAKTVRKILVEAPEGSREEDEALARLKALRRRNAIFECAAPFVAAAFWAGAECLRARVGGGFSWYSLGNAVCGIPALAQAASIGGLPLVSALVVLLSDALAGSFLRSWDTVVKTPGSTRRHFDLTAALVALLAFFWFGANRISAIRTAERAATRFLRVAAVDPELPCVFEGNSAEWDDATERMVSLTRAAAAAKPDFAAWPETSLWETMPSLRMQEGLMRFSGELGFPLFAGGTLECEDRDGGLVKNAYWLFTPEDVSRPYAKRHLVPFGEFIPLDEKIPALRRLAPAGVTCTPGGEAVAFDVAGVRVAPLICFEDTDSPTARSAAKRADLLLGASNDAWFDGSCEGEQHHREAGMRAVETGVPLLRVSNRGVTGVFSPSGERTPDGGALFIHSVAIPDSAAMPASLYLKCGDWTCGFPCAFALLAYCAMARCRRCRTGKNLA